MTDATADSALESSNPDPVERPDWLPSNFNDPADLAKSWKDSQAALTRAQQEASAERTAREAMEAQQHEAQQAQQNQAQQNDIVARIDQARENGDTATEIALLAYVAQQTAAQAAPQPQAQTLPPGFVVDYATRAVSERHDDYASYKERVAGFLAENQYLITPDVASDPQLLAQRLDFAYAQVKAQDVLNGTAPAVTAAQQAEAQRQAKLAAQTLQGANGRPSPSAVSKQEELMGVKVTNYRDLF